jgi:7-carboxy-7-deazaguanine synthase
MNVSEMFYSIQGEGKRIGVPSYFIRLTGCNLHCGFDLKDLNKIDQNNLEEYKKGSWICDSVGVWKEGKKYTTNDIVSFLLEEARKYNYSNIVITGGEPLLQINELKDFLINFKQNYKGTVEVETNGTLDPSLIFHLVDNFNVSPKLYLLPDENWINKKWYDFSSFFVGKVIWKFVVSSREDVETIEKWSLKYNIDHTSIYIMPASENREQLLKNSLSIVELAKEFGFNFTTRLQIIIWDELTGV